MKPTYMVTVTFELECYGKDCAWLYARFSRLRQMPVAKFYACESDGELYWYLSHQVGLAHKLTKRTREMETRCLDTLVDAVLRDLGVPEVEVAE